MLFEEGINHFLLWINIEKNLSKNTLLSYKNELKSFNKYITSLDNFLTENKILVRDIDSKIINNYISICLDYYSSASISHIISVLKSIFNYFIKENIIKINPAQNIIIPKQTKKLPEVISIEDINKILSININSDNYIDIRDQLILEILYSTGCRVSELCNLTLNNIYSNNDIDYIIFYGKGNKERFVPLNKTSYKVLNKYINKAYPHFLSKNKTNESPLLFNKQGRKISRQNVWDIVQKTVLKANLNLKLHPHSFRHTFATHLLFGGADINSVQELLGHSSINTTYIYTHISIKNLSNIYNNSFPRK